MSCNKGKNNQSQTKGASAQESHLSSYLGHGITVRLPETEPGKYAQADFGRLGKVWDRKTKRNRIAWAFITTLTCSRFMHVYITFSQDTRAVIESCEAAWGYFGGIPQIIIFDNLRKTWSTKAFNY